MLVAVRERTLRVDLQEMLGDAGEVLPWVPQSSPAQIGRGWYARLVDGREVYLGDRAVIAAVTITRLVNVA